MLRIFVENHKVFFVIAIPAYAGMTIFIFHKIYLHLCRALRLRILRYATDSLRQVCHPGLDPGPQ